MWSEAFPTCNWFNFPALFLLSLNGIWHTLPLCLYFVRLNPSRKRSAWSTAYVAHSRGQTLHMCSPKLSARSGRNYRFSEPEVNAIHLHQRKGLHCGFLPDLSLHAVADVSGPDHLEAQRLVPRRRDEGAPQVDTVADELRGDRRPGRQGRDGGWKHRQQWSKSTSMMNSVWFDLYYQNVSPLHLPLTSTSPGGQSLVPKSGVTETWDLSDFFSLLWCKNISRYNVIRFLKLSNINTCICLKNLMSWCSTWNVYY